MIDRNAVDTKRAQAILHDLTREKFEQNVQLEQVYQLDSDDLMQYCNNDEPACLNQSKEHSIESLLSRVEGSYLSSSTDEQLLITLPFRLRMGLKYISFSSLDDESCPKKIKIFVNRPSMDFDNVDSINPDHELILTQKLGAAKEKILLKNQLKFKQVTSLTVSTLTTHHRSLFLPITERN